MGVLVGEVEVDEGRDEMGVAVWHAPVSDARMLLCLLRLRHALLGIISCKPILFKGHDLSLTFRLRAENKEYMHPETETGITSDERCQKSTLFVVVLQYTMQKKAKKKKRTPSLNSAAMPIIKPYFPTPHSHGQTPHSGRVNPYLHRHV